MIYFEPVSVIPVIDYQRKTEQGLGGRTVSKPTWIPGSMPRDTKMDLLLQDVGINGRLQHVPFDDEIAAPYNIFSGDITWTNSLF